MDLFELLARYEALGENRDFVAAKALFEQAATEHEDAEQLNAYGYLLESHGRNELRRAAARYERAIELDPGFDKPHYQLISARAGLREPERVVALYEQRLTANPTSVREHRLLVQAYLVACDYAKALAIADAGLGLAPADAALVAARGESKAGLGQVDEALADWSWALELDPEDIGALYSTAFLLEREGRLGESAEARQKIIDWNDARGLTLESAWPKQELARLQAKIAQDRKPE